MDNFVVENLGPIAKADVTFGDLTILTGPQASGKTLFLETFKLVQDFVDIVDDFLETYYEVEHNSFLDYYYGDNMHSIISKNTRIIFNGKNVELEFNYDRSLFEELSINSIYPQEENVNYIPAQRSLAVSEGRIKISDDFVNSPFVLVKFSSY
ncbi:MAG: hypothetical protein J6U21_03530, partial [Bacteroidales bacterium]|nr:hypothetical protein [Bacteroidales bacterium]